MVDSRDVRNVRDDALDKGAEAGRKVESSRPYHILVMVGLICYGVVHLLIAWVALQLAFGNSSGDEASNSGALRNLANQPFGQVLMVVIAAGFATLVIWQLLQALFGHHEYDGFKRVRKRLSSVAKVVLYGVLGFTAARLAMGNDSGGSDTEQSLTGRLMEMPLGRALVFVLAAVVFAVGVYHVVKGVRKKFTEDLQAHPGQKAMTLGQVGYVAKGLSIMVVGGLFGWAAYTFDPEKAGGTDTALRTILEQPFGVVLLTLVALGIAAFGLYCFYWSRNAKHANA